MQDEQQLAMIRNGLLSDDRVSSQSIQVDFADGVATLHGTVHSSRRKLAAQQIVASYDCVVEVRNELVVAEDRPLHDEETAQLVRQALDASENATKQTIVVAAAAGKVTLTGVVATPMERAISEDIARSINGVSEVINLLTPDLTQKIDDCELTSSLKASLDREPGLQNADIGVAMADGIVTLSGEVKDPNQCRLAHSVIGKFGLLHIRNEIRVA